MFSEQIQIAKVTEKGIEISRPYALASEWGYQVSVLSSARTTTEKCG
jgi:hypothetical protein